MAKSNIPEKRTSCARVNRSTPLTLFVVALVLAVATFNSNDALNLLSADTATEQAHLNFLFWSGNNKNNAAEKLEHNYYSQKNQDKWVLENILPNATGRSYFYIDLAANEPEKFSNSKALDVMGWKGLCIDGNKDLVESLREQRGCTVVQAVVDMCEGKLVPWISLEKHVLGGIVGEEYDNTEKNVVGRKGKSEIRKTTTLGHILQAVGAPSMIDYLSLDVEGAEYRVLKNFPFDRYVFRALTIERPAPWLNDLLKEKGYVWIKNFRYDAFYLHGSEPLAKQAMEADAVTWEQIPRKCPDKGGKECPWGPKPADDTC